MAHILFVSHTSRLSAGTSHSLIKMINYLRDNHEIMVISSDDNGQLPSVLGEMGIPFLSPRNPKTFYFLPFIIIQIIKKNIDLVYGNNFSGRSLVALWAAKITHRPFVWHIREALNQQKKNVQWLQHADAIVANSEDTASKVKKFVNNINVTTVPNGVDLHDFQIDRKIAREFIKKHLGITGKYSFVLNVGNICKRKNQLEIIEIAPELLKQYPLIIFIFVGSLQEQDYVEKMQFLSSELGIQDRIFMTGFRKDAPYFFCGSDILVHTAKNEPQGRIILEAMGAKLPVVAYDVGGIGDALLDSYSGYLIPFGDKDLFVKAADKLLSDAELRNQLGANGYTRVEQYFSAEETAKNIERIIEQSISQRK